MLNKGLQGKLAASRSLEEVKDVPNDYPGLDHERIWDELDAVSGGKDRDWVKDCCAATCE